MDIKNTVAVVTGAGSGIGRALSLSLAREGSDVVVSDINEETIGEVCAEITELGRRALPVRTDVSDLASMQNLYDQSIAEMGRVDILVNNAGIYMMGPFDKVTIADWEKIIGVNLWSVIYGVNVFMPHFLERGSGYIVNTGSLAGQVPMLEPAPAYATTKSAVVGLSEGLAVFLKPKGIGVSVVCPGVVQTNIGKSAIRVEYGDGDDEARKQMMEAFQDMDLTEIAEMDVIKVDVVSEKTIEAIKADQFLVLTHETTQGMIQERASNVEQLLDSIIQGRAEAAERSGGMLEMFKSQLDQT